MMKFAAVGVRNSRTNQGLRHDVVECIACEVNFATAKSVVLCNKILLKR